MLLTLPSLSNPFAGDYRAGVCSLGVYQRSPNCKVIDPGMYDNGLAPGGRAD